MIDASSGDGTCSGDGTATVTCVPADFGESEFSFWSADMNALVDTVTANGTLGGEVSGQDGNDVITGSNENGTEEVLDGGDENDRFQDRVKCGEGADTVSADQFDILEACEAITIEERRAAGADTRRRTAL